VLLLRVDVALPVLAAVALRFGRSQEQPDRAVGSS
jgi:hypothetical protein